MSDISYKQKTLFDNSIRYYHDLKNIRQVHDPKKCDKLSEDIFNLINESRMSPNDVINTLKATTLTTILERFDEIINDLENEQMDKFKEDLK